MNTCVVLLGSNVACGKEIIESFIQRSGDMIIKSSEIYRDNNNYYNSVIQIVTSLSMNELVARFKTEERNNGRLPDSKATGIIPLDIDIVIFNGCVIRSNDYNQPYFQRGYKQL